MSNKLMLISSDPAPMNADQLFRASCGIYLHVLEVLNDDVSKGNVTQATVRSRLDELGAAEKNATEALKTYLKGSPNESIVLGYVAHGQTFFRSWAVCVERGIDPLAPAHRRTMKRLFDKWKACEQAYGRAGYRTISFDEWNPATDDTKIRPCVIHLMAVVRKADEAPVFHAVETQRKYPKLKI